MIRSFFDRKTMAIESANYWCQERISSACDQERQLNVPSKVVPPQLCSTMLIGLILCKRLAVLFKLSLNNFRLFVNLPKSPRHSSCKFSANIEQKVEHFLSRINCFLPCSEKADMLFEFLFYHYVNTYVGSLCSSVQCRLPQSHIYYLKSIHITPTHLHFA